MRVVRAGLLCLSLLAGLVIPGEARQAKTLAEVVSTGLVTACADPDNLPFSSADAQWPGYDVEIIRALAAELGARAEFKWIGTQSGRAAIRNLLDGECDLFPGLPVSGGFGEEYPRLAFSRPYYTMGHVIVTRAGAPVAGLVDLKGTMTAVEALSTGDLFLLAKGYGRRTYRTQDAAFHAVDAGEVGAALLWSPVAAWLAKQSGSSALVLVPLPLAYPDLAVSVGVGFLRKDPALKAAIDDAIGRLIANGVIRDSLARYGVSVARGPRERRLGVIPVALGFRRQRRQARLAQAQAEAGKPDPIAGRFLFEANCEQCHGIDGRGGGAVPRLQTYPLGAEDRFVKTVLEGRNSRGMPPWGGLLTENQARSIFAYVHALVPSVAISAKASPEEQARQVFTQICATCHGWEGAGTLIAPSLQAFKGTDDEFVRTVLNGRPGTAMAPFKTIFSEGVARKIREHVRQLARTN